MCVHPCKTRPVHHQHHIRRTAHRQEPLQGGGRARQDLQDPSLRPRAGGRRGQPARSLHRGDPGRNWGPR